MWSPGIPLRERIDRRDPAAVRRARRVVLLLTAAAALSLFDLIVTVHFMTTVGMFEANPMLVWLVRTTGSIAAIWIFKVATVSVAGGLLYRLRRCIQAELGAWVAVLILSVLSIHWIRYADAMSERDAAVMAIVACHDPHFIRLD